MHGIYRGAYVVIFRPNIGGKIETDIGMVVAGLGTTSEPWIVCSHQTWKRHAVKAIDIARSSYYDNYGLSDAEAIFKRITGQNPVYTPRPTPERVYLDVDPF